jgi:hypothetical protein
MTSREDEPRFPPPLTGRWPVAAARAPWLEAFLAAIALAAPGASTADPVDGTWIPLKGPGGTKTVYASHGDRLISIGDSTGAVWQLNLTGTPLWTGLEVAGEAPFPRADAALAYDPVRHRVFAFGGHESNELWAIDLSTTPTWEWIKPTHPSGLRPSIRNDASLVYDSNHDRLILYGGLFDDGEHIGVRSDVWPITLSGTPSWTSLVTAGLAPPGRGLHGAIYDPVRDRMVVYAGQLNTQTTSNDVWELSLGGTPTWNRLLPGGGSPAPRRAPVTIYDPGGDRLVMTGGISGFSGTQKVWSLALNGPPVWTELPVGPLPVPATQGDYDPLRHRLVIRGTTTHALPLNSSFWSWIDVSPSTPQVQSHSASLDPVRGRMILMGVLVAYGQESCFDDSWSLSLGAVPAWKRLDSYGLRGGTSALAYDSMRDRTLAFAMPCDTTSPPVGAVFELPGGGSSWTTLATTGAPPPGLTGAAAVYDPVRDRLLVYGGRKNVPANAYPDEIWALSLAGTPTWSVLGHVYSGRSGHVMLYDTVRDRLVIFGGSTDSYLLNDVVVYSLTGNPFEDVISPPEAGPAPRTNAAAAYVPSRDAIVIFGGDVTTSGQGSHDVWRLSALDGVGSWTQLSPSGVSPGNGSKRPRSTTPTTIVW